MLWSAKRYLESLQSIKDNAKKFFFKRKKQIMKLPACQDGRQLNEPSTMGLTSLDFLSHNSFTTQYGEIVDVIRQKWKKQFYQDIPQYLCNIG